MTEELPEIEIDFATDGTPFVIIGTSKVTDPTELLEILPALTQPEWLFAYAALANHLAQGARYEPIYDPEEFKAAYIARYEAEDLNEKLSPGSPRLHDFGLPDFASMKPPQMEKDTFVFFAENMYLGIPYRVTMATREWPEYKPIAIVE